MNKLKELEIQFNAIKPPKQEVNVGLKLTSTKDGRLALENINSTIGAFYMDADQLQALFTYLKNELKFE